MWFRTFSLLVAAGSWGVTLWLASHKSEHADVLSRYSNGYFGLLVLLLAISLILAFLQFGSAYRWIYSKKHSVILLIGSSAASLLFVEMFIRIVDPIGISYYEHAKNYQLDMIADHDMYYRHQPNLVRSYQGVSVTTNELGMRESTIMEKMPGELRILFLGDSVTFGWGTSQSDIFTNRVSDLLQRKLDIPVRTINAGVGGYNTENEYELFKKFGHQLKPDIVVLMYVGNDIEPVTDQNFDPWSKISFSGKSPPQVIQLILGRIWTYRLISHLMDFRRSEIQSRLSQSNEGWIQSVDSLRKISRICHSANVPFIVLMYRMTPYQIENDIARELRILSKELGFYFDDVLPWFDKKDIRSLINSPVDSHPNGDGHALLAEGIVNVLWENVLSNGGNVIQPY